MAEVPEFDVSLGGAEPLNIEALAARVKAPGFVAIDGCGGSGKTAISGQLAQRMGATVVHVDDFATSSGDGWDAERFERDVAAPLRNGESARYQRYDWDLDELAEWHEIAAGQPVIIEGVNAFTLKLPYVLTVWVDAPRQLRLQRGINRDTEAMRQQWIEKWMRWDDQYVAETHPDLEADVVVDGSGYNHPELRTERMVLRPISLSDVDHLVELGGLGSMTEVRLHIQSHLNIEWVGLVDKEFVGTFGLRPQDNDEFEFSCRLTSNAQNQGYDSEGSRALSEFAYLVLGASNVTSSS